LNANNSFAEQKNLTNKWHQKIAGYSAENQDFNTNTDLNNMTLADPVNRYLVQKLQNMRSEQMV